MSNIKGRACLLYLIQPRNSEKSHVRKSIDFSSYSEVAKSKIYLGTAIGIGFGGHIAETVSNMCPWSCYTIWIKAYRIKNSNLLYIDRDPVDDGTALGILPDWKILVRPCCSPQKSLNIRWTFCISQLFLDFPLFLLPCLNFANCSRFKPRPNL